MRTLREQVRRECVASQDKAKPGGRKGKVHTALYGHSLIEISWFVSRCLGIRPSSIGIPLDTIDTSSINSLLDRLSICEVVMGRSLPNVTDTEWSVLQLLWVRGP